jgi:CheY-like chemotaxis protein
MLYQRNGDVKVIVDCPPNLYIITDSLRLKQVILNLGRNSSKFISKGFIRLRAAEINGLVQLSVEDSGSGIPTEKRALLFAKFQESLDVLSQGTVRNMLFTPDCLRRVVIFLAPNPDVCDLSFQGIGLFLCKSLTELMGGEIHLDDDYDSGIPGCPGTRFVINMEVPPLDPPLDEFSSNSLSNLDCSGGSGAAARTKKEGASIATDLPEKLSVLFVDDDRILRKLFSRSIRTIAPGWTFREAANGETALRLVEADEFDLIFMDMYMASVEKQLLGTETVAALRSRGVTSRICGLSANDVGREFMEAGADAFMIKPFPYKGEELKIALLGILYGKGKGNPL